MQDCYFLFFLIKTSCRVESRKNYGHISLKWPIEDTNTLAQWDDWNSSCLQCIDVRKVIETARRMSHSICSRFLALDLMVASNL